LEDATVSLWWLLAAFVAGGYVGVFVMSLMNIASYEPDPAEMSCVGMPGADARADD
jgi:hypothetical protein